MIIINLSCLSGKFFAERCPGKLFAERCIVNFISLFVDDLLT